MDRAEYDVERGKIREFARATFTTDPVHTDRNAAQAAGFTEVPATLTHTVVAGVTAECRMEGDTFEMEDQRNWSDASYKTYVRPLALPWPYRIPAGEPVRQEIVLSVRDDRGLPFWIAVAA